MHLPLKKDQTIKLLITLIFLSLLCSCRKGDRWPPRANEERADIVYNWYKFIAVVQRPANPQPVVILNNRNFGYIGVGLYEAVRPGIKGSLSLSSALYQMPEMPAVEPGKDYLWSAVANAALASMFKQFLAGLSDADNFSIDSFENANNERFLQFISGAVLERSQAFGRAVADAVHAWSLTDNFNLSGEGWVHPVFPGAWVPTPPAFATVGPFLKDSRPFLAYSLTATAPPMPFPYSEETDSKFYEAAKDVYDVGKALSVEEKAIADWFADSGGPGVGLPAPYHLLSIITTVLESRHVRLGKAAEMYAKTGIAQKDGPINTFRGKYEFNLLRPLTYINNEIDPAWQSYLVNPPYPDYPSGLVGIYAPVLQVLKREFGDIAVTDNANAWKGMTPRSYSSITELAEEAAVSRVYAGIHYRFTQNMSLEMGAALGNEIAAINLLGGPKH